MSLTLLKEHKKKQIFLKLNQIHIFSQETELCPEPVEEEVPMFVEEEDKGHDQQAEDIDPFDIALLAWNKMQEPYC